MVDGCPLRCQENPLTRNSSGVDLADFVLYVSAIQTLQCGETIGIIIRIRICFLSRETSLFETWAGIIGYWLLYNLLSGESETVAYAAHCQQEADLDRPIAGHTNICPSALNSTDNEVSIWLLF